MASDLLDVGFGGAGRTGFVRHLSVDARTVDPVDSPSAWFGLGYQVLVSQFLGFALYYRGLGRGGVARMSQIQQFQSSVSGTRSGRDFGGAD